LGKKVRSEDLQKFWSDSNVLRKRGKFRSVRPIGIFEDAARASGRINIATARRDARLLQEAHDRKSSTYELPDYIKQFLDRRIAELPENQFKGKRMHDAKQVTSIPRILRGDAPAPDLR
jgi:hypothetical protein